jgi:16S rRNA (adenine1518-N6/adenine1519-N6)-dimethyltransferase
LEIGCGLGRLTALIAKKVKSVVAVEVDRGLCEFARERLSSYKQVQVICTDFLKAKHAISPQVTEMIEQKCDSRGFKVVSNLPYCISSPAILNLLEWEIPVVDMHVMLQSEVVDRLVAEPGTSEYGPLTVLARYLACIDVLFSAPPSAFWPSPEVSSTFIRITPRRPVAGLSEYRVFSDVVNRLMQSRRKTLRRGLVIGWDKKVRNAVLQKSELSEKIRPDKLTIEDFVDIANIIVALQ